MYRIFLLPHSNSLAETLAILAAKSNGRDKKHTLSDLKNVADGQMVLYPSLNEDTTCELIGGNTLHLDRKVKDGYETILIIEQIEVLDLCPTLNRYAGTGIADEANHEQLN